MATVAIDEFDVSDLISRMDKEIDFSFDGMLPTIQNIRTTNCYICNLPIAEELLYEAKMDAQHNLIIHRRCRTTLVI